MHIYTPKKDLLSDLIKLSDAALKEKELLLKKGVFHTLKGA